MRQQPRRNGTLGHTEGPLLQVRDLRKSFLHEGGEKLQVLNGIHFSAAEGELLTIVGPSGCGKSTLLRLCGAFLNPDSGEIFFRGRPVEEPHPSRVMVFQEFDQLFPWKRVRSNVELPLLSRFQRSGERTEKDREALRSRVTTLLAEVGLADYADYYPHQLSGGMKQRVALARCLAGEPQLLLMDEPFGSVDAQKREELQDLLLSLCSRRRLTVLFITHDVAEAIYLGDRLVVMGRAGEELRGILDVELPRPRMREDGRIESMRLEIRRLLAGR